MSRDWTGAACLARGHMHFVQPVMGVTLRRAGSTASRVFWSGQQGKKQMVAACCALPGRSGSGMPGPWQLRRQSRPASHPSAPPPQQKIRGQRSEQRHSLQTRRRWRAGPGEPARRRSRRHGCGQKRSPGLQCPWTGRERRPRERRPAPRVKQWWPIGNNGLLRASPARFAGKKCSSHLTLRPQLSAKITCDTAPSAPPASTCTALKEGDDLKGQFRGSEFLYMERWHKSELQLGHDAAGTLTRCHCRGLSSWKGIQGAPPGQCRWRLLRRPGNCSHPPAEWRWHSCWLATGARLALQRRCSSDIRLLQMFEIVCMRSGS